MLVVTGDESPEALGAGLVAGVSGRGGKRVVEDLFEVIQVGAQDGDVGVGAGDVRAARPAVLDVGGGPVVVASA